MDRTPRVLIVGAGFGGIACARALADAPVEVVIVDQRNHHTFQPLLYQVATAGLDVGDICYSVRGVVRRQANATARQDRVIDVDLDGRRVTCASGAEISYDHLVLALGAVTADFGVDGVAEHAFGLKSGHEAITIRNHVVRKFEQADQATTATAAADPGRTTIAIVGGGPTGVEMAGGFAELIESVLLRDFPNVQAEAADVVLIEGADRLLGAFTPRLGAKARHRLERMGVTVHLGRQVSAVRADEIELDDGTIIEAQTIVWAAGVRAHPMAESLGLETASGGRTVVDEHLRVPGRPEVFVIGDLAAASLPDSSLIPQVAPAAIQGGKHVAEVIAAAEADQVDPFAYRDKGSMATIGRNAAVVELPNGMQVTGFAGWVAWLGLHLIMLMGFRNRVSVLVNWAWNYLTYDRGSRAIVEPEPEPEPELESETETEPEAIVSEPKAMAASG